MKSESFHSIFTRFNCSRFEDINTFFRCFRIKITAGSQLFNGAHHTKALDTAQFSFFNGNTVFRQRTAIMSTGNTSADKNNRYKITFMNIRSACNDLNAFFFTHIYLTNDQFRCIRVFFNFFNLADNDLFQIFIHFNKSFNLCTG